MWIKSSNRVQAKRQWFIFIPNTYWNCVLTNYEWLYDSLGRYTAKTCLCPLFWLYHRKYDFAGHETLGINTILIGLIWHKFARTRVQSTWNWWRINYGRRYICRNPFFARKYGRVCLCGLMLCAQECRSSLNAATSILCHENSWWQLQNGVFIIRVWWIWPNFDVWNTISKFLITFCAFHIRMYYLPTVCKLFPVFLFHYALVPLWNKQVLLYDFGFQIETYKATKWPEIQQKHIVMCR